LYLLSVGLHLLAAATWIGALIFFGAVLAPALRAEGLARYRARVLTLVGLRYRIVGWISLAVLVVSGFSNLRLRGVSWQALSDPAFWANPWARVLAWKLALVAFLIAVNLHHDLFLGPRAARLLELHPESEDAARARRSASRLGRLELAISLAVLALAVLLVRGLP